MADAPKSSAVVGTVLLASCVAGICWASALAWTGAVCPEPIMVLTFTEVALRLERVGSVTPSAVCGLVGVGAALASQPLIAFLALVFMAVVAPIAVALSTRLVLATIGGLALGAALAASPVIIGTTPALMMGAIGMLVAGALSVLRRPHMSWQPSMDAGDAVVLGGSVGFAGLLLLPYLNVGAEGVLLDLARGFDHLMHLSMFIDVVRGTASEATAGYPKGFHTALSLAVRTPGGESSTPGLVAAFATMNVLATSGSAAVVGWTAVALAGSLGVEARVGRRRLVAGLVFASFMMLGGLFSGLFEVGHVAFLTPVAAAVGASWIAARPSQVDLFPALVVLAVAALAVAGSYPPVLTALAPAGVRVLWAASRRGRPTDYLFVLGSVTAVVLGATWVVSRWGKALAGLGANTGEVSTPLATLCLVFVLVLVVALLAVRCEIPVPAAAWGPPVGLLVAGSTIAVATWVEGQSVSDAYYVTKLLQGAWVAVSAVLIGTWAALIVERAPTRSATATPFAMFVIGGAAAMAALMVLLPDGRYRVLGSPGLEMATRRIAETDRAQDRSRTIALASVLGGRSPGSVLLIDPSGWLSETPDPRDARRRRILASWAVNVALGPLRATTAEMLRCLSRENAVTLSRPCVAQASRGAEDRVTIVVEDPSLIGTFGDLVNDSKGRISVVLLSNILEDSQRDADANGVVS